MLQSATITQIAEAGALLVIALLLFLARQLDSKKIKRVENTLTENNGGSTVKDSLDKILSNQELTNSRLTNVENSQRRQDRQLERIENNSDRQESKIDAVDKKIHIHVEKFNQHLSWSKEIEIQLKDQGLL